jgi:hypothetical protein
MSTYTLSGPSRIPLAVWAAVLAAAMTGRQRRPLTDGDAIWRAIAPPVVLSGEEWLPASGPYVVVANHLNGPGVWVGLAAGLIASVVGKATPNAAIRGVGVAAYRDFKLWSRIRVPDGLTEILFQRFYAVYDIIRMPHASEGAGARSAAVRAILAALRHGHVVILFPEGGNVSNFRMRPIQPGVGDLLRLAARTGAPIVPIAVAPLATTFELRVGKPLAVQQDANRDDIEEATGRAIANMMPADLRGPYGGIN